MRTHASDVHESLKESFFQAFKDRPHHAWILKGPKGVGKIDFAKQLAASLLVQMTPDDQVFTKIENQNHPNFLYISPDDSTNKAISIEQIRQIFHFLQQTSHDGGWKVVLLNSLNDLTTNGANGLLKILESPPAQTVFFLIQHNGRAPLPTIVSRCAQLSFQSQQDNDLSTLLPEGLSSSEQTLLLSLAQGRPHYLKDLLDQNALSLYHSFQEALKALTQNDDYTLSHSLAQSMGRDPFKLEIFLDIVEWWLQKGVKEIALQQRNFFQINCSLSSLLDIHQTISKIIKWKRTLDLDNRQLILNIFIELKKLRA